MNMDELKAFVQPYYADKDIMHDMWHIELVGRWVERIIKMGNYEPDRDALTYALYFHGFIYSDEEAVRRWLSFHHVPNGEKIIKIAWESQRPEIPETLEGRILHDAHVLEGGKTYMVVKTLITGSVRGQSLSETLRYMKDNVIGKNRCYLPETVGLCEEMDAYAGQFLKDIQDGIGRFDI